MEKFLDLLARCPLFEGLNQDEIRSSLNCLSARPMHYAKGGAILTEGDPASQLGILLSGSAQVMRLDYSGSRSIMAVLEPGDLFAEAFACAGVSAMPVSVIALEPAQALLIDAQRLTGACSGGCGFHHRMIYNLMRILATKNLVCHQKIEVISQRSTRDKLLTYLFLQAQRTGSRSFTIPYDRQALADYLEVDRSGLSAEIGKLRREGVLACEKSHFTLLTAAPASK